MKIKIKYFTSRTIAILLTIIMIISVIQVSHEDVYAINNEDPVIVVSLGDSYSSGEGIEPFYGQEKSLDKKVKDNNWLAHRSKKSWPALLKVSNLTGTMKDYWSESTNSSACKWYFRASSGAETVHFKNKQKKSYSKKTGLFSKKLEGTVYLPGQLDVFNEIKSPVDYVTLTAGGNDVDFAGIIESCATGSTYFHTSGLEDKIDNIWANFNQTEKNIKQVYLDIAKKAGPQAEIIVAGYPKLLDKSGKGALISAKEAKIVNENVSKFNAKIKGIVLELQKSGVKIHFVDVEQEFDKDGGHQAYSKTPWINKIIFGTKSEDLKDWDIVSAYSMHPNEEGAKAYARCVNTKINKIETDKKEQAARKTSKASERFTPTKGALVQAYKDGRVNDSTTADKTENYYISISAGCQQSDKFASNRGNFESYTTATEKTTTYMGTFSMLSGCG